MNIPLPLRNRSRYHGNMHIPGEHIDMHDHAHGSTGRSTDRIVMLMTFVALARRSKSRNHQASQARQGMQNRVAGGGVRDAPESPRPDVLNKLSGVKSTPLWNLLFLGYSGRLVQTDYEVPNIRSSHHNNDSDGDYEKMDRFGRTIQVIWYDYANTNHEDSFDYAYDYAGNRTYRDIPSALYASDDKDQKFTYDGLNRLTQINRGTLASGDVTDANANFRQKWGLSQVGNWADFEMDGTLGSGGADNDFADATDLDQARTHNDANEISGITEGGSQAVWIEPAYDLAGNMTEGPKPGSETAKHKYVYDAWNRLVKVTDNSDVTIATYEFDGINRRIVKDIYISGSSDHVLDFYYNENWQVLEVRKDGDTDPLKQYIWHPYYVDALLLRYHDSDTDGSAIDTHYYAHDANMNVTAVFNSSGAVVERYEYDSYGQPLVLDSDFSNDADNVSDIDNEILFAGYRYDPESGLFHVRNRMYHPELGRWLQRDPLGDGSQFGLYVYVRSMTTRFVDPSGLLEEGGESSPESLADITSRIEKSKDIPDKMNREVKSKVREKSREMRKQNPGCLVECTEPTIKSYVVNNVRLGAFVEISRYHLDAVATRAYKKCISDAELKFKLSNIDAKGLPSSELKIVEANCKRKHGDPRYRVTGVAEVTITVNWSTYCEATTNGELRASDSLTFDLGGVIFDDESVDDPNLGELDDKALKELELKPGFNEVK